MHSLQHVTLLCLALHALSLPFGAPSALKVEMKGPEAQKWQVTREREYGQDRRFRTQKLELGDGLEDTREKEVNKESEGFVPRSRDKH